MNRRICRQVLECGDGVFGVTTLAVAALNIAKRTADTATSTQSGDFEDSVAALQDADALAAAPFRFHGVQFWRSKLSSNPNVAQVFQPAGSGEVPVAQWNGGLKSPLNPQFGKPALSKQ